MSMMINNPDGSQTEVFTKDEISKAKDDATKTATDAATKAAEEVAEKNLEEYKKNNPAGAEEIEKLKKSVEEKTEKITELEKGEGGGGGNDDNKGNEEQAKRLREEREEMKKELEGKITEMGDKIAAVTGDTKAELVQAAVKAASQSDIEAAGGRDEFQKKVELKYDSFGGDIITKADISARVDESVTLVTGNKPAQSIMDNASQGGARGEGDHGKPAGEVSDATKSTGKNLGISDEDRENFGPGGSEDKSEGQTN